MTYLGQLDSSILFKLLCLWYATDKNMAYYPKITYKFHVAITMSTQAIMKNLLAQILGKDSKKIWQPTDEETTTQKSRLKAD